MMSLPITISDVAYDDSYTANNSHKDPNSNEDEVTYNGPQDHHSDDDDDTSIEEDLATLDKMNIHYDFSAWDSFRKSLPTSRQQALKQSLANSRKLSFHLNSFHEEESELDDERGNNSSYSSFRLPSFNKEGSQCENSDSDDDDGDGDDPFKYSRYNNNSHNASLSSIHEGSSHQDNIMSSLKLTAEERFDNAAWRMRLEVDAVFSKRYELKEWERKEMAAIVNFLGLKDPSQHPDYLNKTWQQTTKKAISSIFFPKQQPSSSSSTSSSSSESQPHQSVLLKRGPVLVGGEERELMLFTNGFVLSCVELDTLVNLLLDASSGMGGMVENGSSEGRQQIIVKEEEICERFSCIDTDQSGYTALDRSEIRDFFRGMGMALSATILNDLMKRFDSNSDGTISLQEFKTMMHELQGQREDMQQRQQQQKNNSRNNNGGSSFWRDLGGKLKRALSTKHVTRKLDTAFEMSNVERIEILGDTQDDGCAADIYIDKELAPLALAVYLKEDNSNIPPRFPGGNMGRLPNEPLVIMCAKPGHVDAWVEAFRICVAHQCDSIDWGVEEIQRSEPGDNVAVDSEDWRCSTIDWGDDDDEEKNTSFVKKERNPVGNWRCTTVDWGS